MKLTLSNSFIIISTIFTLVSFQNPEILNYGMSQYFLERNDYINFLIQIAFYSFLHGWWFHLIFNSLFLYIFWNQIEERIGKKMYMFFFVFTTIFNAIFILFFSQGVTIWISGFWMALISLYTLILYQEWNSEYKWWITAIIINTLIGLSATISFAGHLWGAIMWALFFGIMKIIKK